MIVLYLILFLYSNHFSNKQLAMVIVIILNSVSLQLNIYIAPSSYRVHIQITWLFMPLKKHAPTYVA